MHTHLHDNCVVAVLGNVADVGPDVLKGIVHSWVAEGSCAGPRDQLMQSSSYTGVDAGSTAIHLHRHDNQQY